MTDKEIIKGLECCIGYHECSKCPYNSGAAGTSECMSECTRDALDLINRQKAEISVKNKLLDIAEAKFETIKAEAIKDFAEQIHTEIRQALESNYKARAERMAHPIVDMADEFISYCDGKIHALRGIDEFIDSLIGAQQ